MASGHEIKREPAERNARKKRKGMSTTTTLMSTGGGGLEGVARDLITRSV